MQVILYNNASDSEHVTKNITELTRLNDVHPVDVVDLMSPLIRIGSVSLDTLNNVNYAYIPDYGRYYYVDPPIASNNKVFALQLNVDVLMSFADEIKNLTAVIARQENNYNLYLQDPEFKVYANTEKKTIKFSKNPFTKSAQFLLTVSGGT